ncbi:MAG: tetratricopeptide repeat protein [Rhizobacter sp.]|nr:tetratricopeptide repeat protein [Bacteriovorax sp.]
MKNISTTPITKPLAETKVESKSPSQESSFDELFLKKDYKGAAQYLLKNKQQIDSGIFHYNLGTVYSKMGDQATARFHLEKAIQEGYINSASLNNLTFVKSQLQVDDLTTSTSLPDELVSTATSIPAAGYLSMTLLMVVIFMLLIRLKKIEKKWVIAVVMLLSLTPFLFSNFYVKNINYAVALSDIPLYEGPSKIFNEKGKVRAGSKIVIGQFKDGWFQVEFPMSLSGWINKDQLGLY